MIDWSICEPIDYFLEDLDAANAAEASLETPRMEPDYVSVITHISAFDATTSVSSIIYIGYVSGGIFHTLKATKPTTPATCDWDGEIALREGDIVKARFVNTTTGDDIYLQVNGYKYPVK